MMRNAQQLKFSQHHTEYTRHDLLFNEIINLLQNQNVGWREGIHQTLGKEFVKCITNTFWYIDLYLDSVLGK